MARRKVPRRNLAEFTKGVRGKVLDKISITNEVDWRAISLEFDDKTELTITINVGMAGKLELFDFKTGNAELLEQVGRIPAERFTWGKD